MKNYLILFITLVLASTACKKKKVTLQFSTPVKFQVYAQNQYIITNSSSVLVSSDSIKSIITVSSSANDSMLVINADTSRLYAPLGYVPINGGWPIYINAAKDSITISEKLGGVGSQNWKYSYAKKM